MKYLVILTVGVCLLLTAVPAMADQAEDEAAIRKMIKQAYEVANKHDVDAFISHFAENFENQSGTAKGREAWGKRLAGIWERQKGVQYKPLEEMSLIFASPDAAIYKHRDEVTGNLDTDGKPLQPQKRLVAYVVVRNGDKWLIAGAFSTPLED